MQAKKLTFPDFTLTFLPAQYITHPTVRTSISTTPRKRALGRAATCHHPFAPGRCAEKLDQT